MDVLQHAGEAVGQRDAQRSQQVVPAGLHVLTGPALGVTLAAHVLVVRSHYVGDEVVATTGCLEGDKRNSMIPILGACEYREGRLNKTQAL